MRLLIVLCLLCVSIPAWCSPSPGDITLVQSGNAGFASATDPAVRITGPSGVVSTSSQTGYAPQDVVVSLSGGWTAKLDHSAPVHVALHIPSGVPPGSYTCTINFGYDTEDFETSTFTVDAAPAGTCPPNPTGLTATVGSGCINLSWTPTPTATQYSIYRTTGVAAYTFYSGPQSGQTFSDSAGTGGTTYYYEVVAGNSYGNSGASNVATCNFPNGGTTGGGGGTPPASGTGLTAALSWSGSALSITYAGQDSFVQCSWAGGSYVAGDGATLTTPAAYVLNPTPPVGSSVVVFGKNTSRMVLVVHDNNTAIPPDNVTTTTGGDGYVPTGVNAPRHDPGALKIGFGKFGSISLPSGWWSQVINFATQLALEAEGLTGPQITLAMSQQTAVINAASQAQHQADRDDADANASNNRADADHNASSITDRITATEQQWKLDFVSTTQSIYTPQPSTISETQNLLNQFLTWGPYQFIISSMSIFQQAGRGSTQYASQASGLSAHDVVAPGDQVGPISIHVPGVAVDSTIRLDPNGKLVPASAGVWYDSGLSVPFQFESMTHAPAWPIYRLLVGGSIHIMFIGIFIKWFLPKAHF